MKQNPRACTLIGSTLALALAAAAHAAGPHEHGVATMSAVLEGGQLQIELRIPARDVVGFERAPRNDQERKRIAEARDKLTDGAALIAPTTAARCAAARPAEVKSELLNATAPASAGHRHGHGSKDDDDHADFHATYSFTCADPAALAALEQTLFKSFPRLKQIRVEAVGAKGPKRATLTPARSRFSF